MTIRLKSEREAREFFAAIKRPYPETRAQAAAIAMPTERSPKKVKKSAQVTPAPKPRRTVSAWPLLLTILAVFICFVYVVV